LHKLCNFICLIHFCFSKHHMNHSIHPREIPKHANESAWHTRTVSSIFIFTFIHTAYGRPLASDSRKNNFNSRNQHRIKQTFWCWHTRVIHNKMYKRGHQNKHIFTSFISQDRTRHYSLIFIPIPIKLEEKTDGWHKIKWWTWWNAKLVCMNVCEIHMTR